MTKKDVQRLVFSKTNLFGDGIFKGSKPGSKAKRMDSRCLGTCSHELPGHSLPNRSLNDLHRAYRHSAEFSHPTSPDPVGFDKTLGASTFSADGTAWTIVLSATASRSHRAFIA